MANNRENIVDIELNACQLHRSFNNHMLGEGDKNAQIYGFRLFRNGQPENIDGSVAGYFIRPDGQTVALVGEKNGNIGTVTLEENCFAVSGNFLLAIKVIDSTMTNTVRIVEGTILDTVKGEIVDPGNVIPDLTDYAEYAERIEAAAETIEGATIETELINGTRYKLIAELE